MAWSYDYKPPVGMGPPTKHSQEDSEPVDFVLLRRLTAIVSFVLAIASPLVFHVLWTYSPSELKQGEFAGYAFLASAMLAVTSFVVGGIALVAWDLEAK